MDDWMFILGHDKLKKRVVTPGAGVESRPRVGQRVTIDLSGRLEEDGREISGLGRLVFSLGEEEVIPALDLSIALMEVGETSEVVTHSQYAYGDLGRDPDVPPGAAIAFTIELISVEDPDYSSSDLRLAAAEKKKVRGNDLYSRGDYSSAINLYTKALEILDEEESSVDLRCTLHLNLAAAQLKIDAYDAALQSCNTVLKFDQSNVKALFRKGKCLDGKGMLDQAIQHLKKALALEPETKMIHSELARLMAKKKKEADRERALYSKMLGTKPLSPQPKEKKSSSWLWVVGSAAVAATLGMAAYRYMHV